MQYDGNLLRHELKYYINVQTYYALRGILSQVMRPDQNMKDEEGYLITSVYFDDVYHSAVEEKNAGVPFREKIRIRSYDREDGKIRLECKRKRNEYIGKESVEISRREYEEIMMGNFTSLESREEEICKRVYAARQVRLIHPVVAVEYLREAYIEPAGNVRVTFDKDLAVSLSNPDMFAPDFATSFVMPGGIMVMEVKFDEFLPEQIRQMIRTAAADRCAISKYTICREQKRGVYYR